MKRADTNISAFSTFFKLSGVLSKLNETYEYLYYKVVEVRSVA